MIARAGAAAVIAVEEILVPANRGKQRPPGRRCAIATDGQHFGAVVQPAHHVHIDHIVYPRQVHRRVFGKVFGAKQAQFLARKSEKQVIIVFQFASKVSSNCLPSFSLMHYCIGSSINNLDNNNTKYLLTIIIYIRDQKYESTYCDNRNNSPYEENFCRSIQADLYIQ